MIFVINGYVTESARGRQRLSSPHGKPSRNVICSVGNFQHQIEKSPACFLRSVTIHFRFKIEMLSSRMQTADAESFYIRPSNCIFPKKKPIYYLTFRLSI